MTIEALAAIAGQGVDPTSGMGQTLSSLRPTHASTQTPAATFDALVAEVQGLNDNMLAGQNGVAAMAVGNTEGLETVMLNMERTRLQFDVLMSVRNRVLEAYQEIMRMQL